MLIFFRNLQALVSFKRQTLAGDQQSLNVFDVYIVVDVL